MRKKILIATKYIPYPLRGGGYIAQFYFLKELLSKYDLTYLTFINSSLDLENLNRLGKSLPQLKIEYIDLRLKRDNLAKINRIKKRLKNNIITIIYSFIPQSLKTNFVNINKLNNSHSMSEVELWLLKSFLKSKKFDIVQIEFINVLSAHSAIPKGTKKIFVHHELEFKRNATMYSQIDTETRLKYRYLKKQEIKNLKQYDIVIVFNNDDAKLPTDQNVNVVVSPFGIPDELISKSIPSHSFVRLLFMGNESHKPNKDGLVNFIEFYYENLPDEFKLPLFITGNWSDDFKNKYLDNKSIIFTGFIDNLSGYYEESVLVVPTTSGSGIRTKILEAMVNNVPIVSTPFAAEGLFSKNDNQHFILYTTPEDFLKQWINCITKKEVLLNTSLMAKNYYDINFNNYHLLNLRMRVYEYL